MRMSRFLRRRSFLSSSAAAKRWNRRAVQALKYNNITRVLDTETIYDNGKHHVWPGSFFIKYARCAHSSLLPDLEFSSRFKKTFQSMDIKGSGNCISNDGIVIAIEVRFMYRVVRTPLGLQPGSNRNHSTQHAAYGIYATNAEPIAARLLPISGRTSSPVTY